MSIAQEFELFSASPFSLVASAETASCWAGRPDVREALDRVCRTYIRRTDSCLDVIWANFGAGKTHALFHLAFMLSTDYRDKCKAVTSFVEMPQALSNFLDLYRLIVGGLSSHDLECVFAGIESNGVHRNLRRAATAVLHGGEVERAMAVDWLFAGRPYLKELKSTIGIDARIESDGAACHVLDNLVELCRRKNWRFVILLDEFQRVGTLSKLKRESILSNMRTIFSHNSSHLSLVLAITSRAEDTAIKLIPPELRTLMGIRPIISLPEMNPAEAKNYVLERFQFFRRAGYSGSDAAPFSIEIIDTIIGVIGSKDHVKLIPRTLHQVVAAVYDEILDRPGQAITSQDVQKFLERINWSGLDL